MPNALGQNYLPVARYFGIEDGLPHRQVNCILQDRQGFIWVATEGGVARFDGLRFKIFNKADNGLSTDTVSWMLEDATGNLWLISKGISTGKAVIGSVDILHPVSGRITPLDQYVKEKPPVPFESIHLLGMRQIAASTGQNPSKPGTLFFGTFKPGGWVSWHPDQGWSRVIAPSITNLELLTRTPQNGFLGLTSNPRSDDKFFVELNASGNPLRYFQGAAGNRFVPLYGNAKNPERYFALEEDKGSRQPIYWEIKAGADKTRLALPMPKLRGSLHEWELLLGLEQENLWLTEHDIFNHKGETLLDLLAQFPGD